MLSACVSVRESLEQGQKMKSSCLERPANKVAVPEEAGLKENEDLFIPQRVVIEAEISLRPWLKAKKKKPFNDLPPTPKLPTSFTLWPAPAAGNHIGYVSKTHAARVS